MYTETQIRNVLKACNIRIIQELNDEFLVFCIFHPNHRTPSAEIHKETGRLFCFACHASASLIEVVQHAKSQTVFQATRLIESKADGFKREDPVVFDKPPLYVQFNTDLVNKLHQTCLETDEAIEYLASRNITLASIKQFEIGYSAKQGMVVVPMHSPDGMCVGFVGRSIQGKTFKNSDDLPRSAILFNLHRTRLCGTIVLVESTFDAIRIEQCGHNAVASLGGSLSKLQLELLSKTFNSIIIAPDNDDAGKVMAAKLVNKLGDRVTVAKLPGSVKDIGDLNDKDLTDFLAHTDPLLAFIEKDN